MKINDFIYLEKILESLELISEIKKAKSIPVNKNHEKRDLYVDNIMDFFDIDLIDLGSFDVRVHLHAGRALYAENLKDKYSNLQYNSLKHLDLASSNLKINYQKIDFLLENYESEELNLTNNGLSVSHINQFFKEKKPFNKLKKLNLSLNGIRDFKDYEHLPKSIEFLNLSKNYLEDRDLVGIANSFENLTGINISKNKITCKSLDLLTDMLNNQLNFIDISNNDFQSSSLCKILKKMSTESVNKLRFNNCNIEADFIHLMSYVNLSEVIDLDLSCNSLESNALGEILSNKSLENATKVNISNNSVRTIEEKFNKFKHLKHLDLENSQMELRIIRDFIELDFNLVSLNWAANYLNFESLNSYAESDKFKELKYLNLSSCETDDDFNNFDPINLKNSRLKYLNLNGLSLSQSSTNKILLNLPDNINYLGLAFNDIRYDSLLDFVDSYDGKNLYLDILGSQNFSEQEITYLEKISEKPGLKIRT